MVNYVLWRANLKTIELDYSDVSHATNEYLAGASIANFQRLTGRSFQNIHKYFPMSLVLNFVNMNEDDIFKFLSFQMLMKEHPDCDELLQQYFVKK